MSATAKMVKVYVGSGGVFIFPVDRDGEGIGEDEYFCAAAHHDSGCDCGLLDREDFDSSLKTLPLAVHSKLKVEAD